MEARITATAAIRHNYVLRPLRPGSRSNPARYAQGLTGSCGSQRRLAFCAGPPGRTPMNYRRLGASGLKVSEVALGSWTTYGGSVAEADAVRIIQRAFELGINTFDTAWAYASFF